MTAPKAAEHRVLAARLLGGLSGTLPSTRCTLVAMLSYLAKAKEYAQPCYPILRVDEWHHFKMHTTECRCYSAVAKITSAGGCAAQGSLHSTPSTQQHLLPISSA